MNCEEFTEMLDRYADLTDAEIQELNAHAETCEACSEELSFMQSILSTAKSLPPLEPPSDFLESINARLDKELAEETPIRRFVRRSRPYAYRYGSMAACVALAVTVGVNANSLLSKMNNDTNGVIIEEKTNSDAKDRMDMDNIPITSENGQNETAENTFAPSPAFPSSTVNPKIDNTADDIKTAKVQNTEVPKTSSTTSTVQQKNTGSNNASSRNGNAAGNVNSSNQSTSVPSSQSVPTAEPQPTAAQNSTANDVSPNETIQNNAQPAALQAEAETPAVVSDTSNAEPSPKNEATPEGYSIKTRNIVHDDYAAVPTTEPDKPAVQSADTQSDYTIAFDKSEDSYAYATLSTILAIKETDSVRAQELIDIFISGSYGNYYKITAADMKTMLGQFDREGLWYEVGQVNSSDTIWFKVITMKS